MVTINVIQWDLAQNAARIGWALLKCSKKETGTFDTAVPEARNGIKLLEFLEQAQEISQKGEPEEPSEFSLVYYTVRRKFFAERVNFGDPGWKEWNAVINREFEQLFTSSSIMEKVKSTKESLKRFIKDPSQPDSPQLLDDTREFFAYLSAWLSSFPL